MTRYFNVEGSCNPKEHYMVNLDNRLECVKRTLVDRKKYFVINKGRQYGKTTMLRTLEDYLKEDYIVLLLDFQEVETANFASGAVFSLTFAKKLSKAAGYTEAADKEKIQRLLSKYKKDNPDGGLDELFEILSIMCAEVSRPIVLMIDEVGHTGSCERYLCIHINQVIRFLYHS